MIILSIACDNLYMFKDFHLDFTYGGGNDGYSICHHDPLFPGSKIYVRKRLVLLGANASGKTTFGELLCAVSNFLLGRPVESGALNLYHALYDKDKAGTFTVEAAIPAMDERGRTTGWVAYRVMCRFTVDGSQQEWIQRVDVTPASTIEDIRGELDAAPKHWGMAPREAVKVGEGAAVYGGMARPFVSMLLAVPPQDADFGPILSHQGIGFHYIFSSFADSSQPLRIDVPVSLFNKILPVIDNSIDGVDALAVKGKDIPTSSYVIRFKNGSQLTIPDNNLRMTDRTRLSHGTFEVLTFLNMMEEIRHRPDDTFYIDEQLAHLHAELEAYFLMRLFQMDSEAQIFVTSHTNDLLDLNVPTSTFLLFKRNEDQSVSALFMDEKLGRDDPDVRAYYEDDYFGVLPDYSVLDRFFGEEGAGHEK